MLRRPRLGWTAGTTAAISFALVVSGSTGCVAKNCNTNLIDGLGIVVENATTKKFVCDAHVVATDGAYSEVLSDTFITGAAGEADSGSGRVRLRRGRGTGGSL